MSISSLKAAVTAAGATPTQHTQVGLLRELVTAIGGTPTQWSVVGLLREAVTASGGTPTKWDKVGLWRELIAANGGAPISFDLDTLIAQAASVGFFVPSKLYGGSDRGFAFDFTDKSKLFQNSNGTGAVVNTNDPIGYATDLSGKGNHATQATGASRPLWDATGAVCDGTKNMATPAIDLSATDKLTVIACVKVPAGGNHAVFNHGSFNPGDAILALIGANGNLWTSTVFGSTGRADVANTRGVTSASFKVVSAVFDISGATGLDEAKCRIDGEAYGATLVGGPAGAGNFASRTATIMGAYFGNMTGTMARLIVIGRLLNATELLRAEQWAGRAADVPIIDELPPDGPAYYNLLNSYGQSLSTGSHSTPPLSIATRFSDVMLTSGVHLFANGSDMSGLVPLVESTATESATPEGETPVSGAAEMIHERGGALPFIGVATGFPGLTIAQMSSATSPYNNFKTAATQAWRRAREAGRHFKVRAFLWMQGESDGANNAYAANLDTLRTSLNTDLKAITGQTENIWCLTYQLDRAKIGLEHLAASDGYANIRVAFPAYFLAHNGDGVHLTNQSSKIAGAYFGLAYKAVILDGNTSWQPLRILSAARSGSQVDIVYNPVGDLVFDTSIVAAQTNQGFRLYQSDGTTPITINSVARVGSNIVRIAAASSVPSGAILRYGFADPADHTAAIAKGNLRDSQGASIVFDGGGINYPMHNWAVLEQKTLP